MTKWKFVWVGAALGACALVLVYATNRMLSTPVTEGVPMTAASAPPTSTPEPAHSQVTFNFPPAAASASGKGFPSEADIARHKQKYGETAEQREAYVKKVQAQDKESVEAKNAALRETLRHMTKPPDIPTQSPFGSPK